MLKKKSKLNYRKGNASKSCGTCDSFRPDTQIYTMNGSLREEPRCIVIGLDNGRMYRVNQKSVCDRHHDSSIKLDGEEMLVSMPQSPEEAA